MKFTLITGQCGIGKSNAIKSLVGRNDVTLIDLGSKERKAGHSVTPTMIIDHPEVDFDQAETVFNSFENVEKEIDNVVVITQDALDLGRPLDSWDYHIHFRPHNNSHIAALYKKGRCVSKSIKASNVSERLEKLLN